MKTNLSMAMLIALVATGFVACNSPDTKNNSSTTQTDTSGMKQVMVTDEIYTCTMHNEVMSINPGKCSKCGMTLVKQKMTDGQMEMMKNGSYIKAKE